ncbi:MAG: DUF4423 domain-containing protein [Myxococcales bacterium]|nr:DUF4423 domain-containing protein [Myxococcales bacterium]
MNYENIASELVRALRGSRSQVALSRRLGYRTNAVYTWESGRRWPSASTFLRVAQRVGVDVGAALARFYRTPPPWLHEAEVGPELVALLLRDLRGRTPIGTLSERAEVNRYTVSRWLSGRTEPKLPAFLSMVEATTLRLTDFVAAFVDPEQIPSIRGAFAMREAQRTLALEEPWAPAVLRCLEIDLHTQEEVANALQLPEAQVERCLRGLRRAGQIRPHPAGGWRPAHVLVVDTRRSPESARLLKSHWARAGTERLAAGAEGAWAYNVFAVSRGQLQRIQELQTAYFQELRSLIAEPEPAGVVALVNLQVVELTQS